MADEANGEIPRQRIAWTWNRAPRILATLILTGLGTLVVSFIFLCPVLEETREEVRCSYYPRFCRAALSEIESVPSQLRTEKWPVVGELPPNLTVIERRAEEGDGPPVRATLSGIDRQVVRVFVPRETQATVTDGQGDYTLEFMKSTLANVKARRRREWMTMLAVWLATWGLLAWCFLPRLTVSNNQTLTGSDSH